MGNTKIGEKEHPVYACLAWRLGGGYGWIDTPFLYVLPF